jgi:hypothetical protein
MGWLGKALGSVAGGVGGFLLGGPGGAIKGASLAGGLIGGSDAQGKSDDMLRRAMALKQQGWDARAPLRASTLDRASQPMVGREDLSAIYSDPGNPYARTIPRPMVAQPTTATPIAPRPQTPDPRSVLQQAIRRSRTMGGIR